MSVVLSCEWIIAELFDGQSAPQTHLNEYATVEAISIGDLPFHVLIK